MKTWTTHDLIRQSMIAAIYVVLVYVFSFASFGLVQFRLAEILMIFVFFDKKSIVGLTIGCLIANWVGGALVIDIFVGSLATLIGGYLMWQFRKWPILALLFPVISNGIIVGLILTYAYVLAPLYISIPSVMLGEFAVLYVIGLPIYLILRKNKGFLEFFQ
jgi:uncharacterized membrane protein